MTTTELRLFVSKEEIGCLLAALANAKQSLPPASLPHARPLLEKVTAALDGRAL